MNSVLILVFIVCLIISLYFSIKQERKFNEMHKYIKAIGEQTDEKALEYVKYVTQAIKNKQNVLNYSAWYQNIL